MKTSRSFNVRSFEEQRIWELPWSAEREKWQCLPHDIRTNPNWTSTEVLVLPFVFTCRIRSLHAPNLQLLVFSRLFTAHPKNTIPASTTQSLAKYMTSMDDWARTRSSATNREIFSEFDKPNFLQFVQSGGLIHDTLFRFGTVFVVKRHALLDCLSLLVSSTTGLTIAKRFRSKLSQPKLSLVHHDSHSVSPHSVPIATSSNEFREKLKIKLKPSSSAGPMHR